MWPMPSSISGDPAGEAKAQIRWTWRRQDGISTEKSNVDSHNEYAPSPLFSPAHARPTRRMVGSSPRHQPPANMGFSCPSRESPPRRCFHWGGQGSIHDLRARPPILPQAGRPPDHSQQTSWLLFLCPKSPTTKRRKDQMTWKPPWESSEQSSSSPSYIGASLASTASSDQTTTTASGDYPDTTAGRVFIKAPKGYPILGTWVWPGKKIAWISPGGGTGKDSKLSYQIY